MLDLGANRFEGPGRELLEDPKVAELYLGGTARVDRPEVAQERWRTSGRKETAGAHAPAVATS